MAILTLMNIQIMNKLYLNNKVSQHGSECVAGVPNSGKSSLINALRHAAKVKKEGSSGKAATGPTAGLTRHISGFQVQ